MTGPSRVGAIHAEQVTKTFTAPTGSRYTAVQGVTLDVPEGVFLSVVGPSGCGKSTLLNLVAGLTTPSSGAIEIYGKRLSGLNRRASYMFQQDGLLPWKTVLDNVILGLSFNGRQCVDARELGRKWIRRVGLEGFADCYPHQLSGGMRKRVAMAQSWIDRSGCEPCLRVGCLMPANSLFSCLHSLFRETPS